MTPRQAFLRACELDVLVSKPGNVSVASPGHGMDAGVFLAAAQAAAGPLFEPRARVGARIERATAASLAAARCNANLGIVLLCAPIAAACEQGGALADASALRAALARVLAALDRDDARAAFRAIANANPGGLGHAPEQDVRGEPEVGLREAMALAADRDSIARQYADDFADVFDTGAPLCAAGATPQAVRAVFLAWLARWPDSHIVRKHGLALAQTVMSAAQQFAARTPADDDTELVAWDERLKAAGVNPGTSADLTVAAVMISLLWHGS